jgi:hypothetical protein
LIWFYEKDKNACTPVTMGLAAKHSHFDIVKWISDNTGISSIFVLKWASGPNEKAIRDLFVE